MTEERRLALIEEIKEKLDDKVDEIAREFQDAHGIKDGGAEPLSIFELLEREEMLALTVADILIYQMGDDEE